MLRNRLERARLSLLGLALGDALGSQFFVPGNRDHLSSRSLLTAPWQWTDDTEMACSVYLTLAIHHSIDQDALAASFARRHDFDRGYGPATNRLLRLVRDGRDWRILAASLFGGAGSWGNGAAMRIAPLGAFGQTANAEVAAVLSRPSVSWFASTGSCSTEAAAWRGPPCQNRAAAESESSPGPTALSPRLVLIICTWSRPDAFARYKAASAAATAPQPPQHSPSDQRHRAGQCAWPPHCPRNRPRQTG
jgi:hypothetical protein